jgi:hypothetical protein
MMMMMMMIMNNNYRNAEFIGSGQCSSVKFDTDLISIGRNRKRRCSQQLFFSS